MSTIKIFVPLFVALFITSGHAQSPTLDVTFGTGGQVVTPIGKEASNLNSIAIQRDGKIVAAGFTDGSGRQVALARYNVDGTLDNTFGEGGKVTTKTGLADGAYAVAIQSDGKIVAAGGTYNTTLDFLVVRYNVNGSLDLTFDRDGFAIAPVGPGSDLARAMAIQPDGKLVIAGAAYDGEHSSFALTRFNTDGSLDKTFGTDGVLTTTFENDFSDAFSIAVQPDEKIVATGTDGKGVFAMSRYNPNGSLDNSFDTDGKLTSMAGTGKGVVILPNKKILVTVATPNKEFGLVRYFPNGSLDNTFGTDGMVSTPFEGEAEPNALAIQPDEKIIVAGNSWTETSYADFALARYLPNGTLDTGFGTDGRLYLDMGTGFNTISHVALQPDGKIVMGGIYNVGEEANFGLARLSPKPIKAATQVKRQGKRKVFLDEDRSVIADSSSAYYYRLINFKDDKPLGVLYEYYRSTKRLAFTGTMVQDRPVELWKGKATWYNQEGIKELENVYSHGHLYTSEAVYYNEGAPFTDPMDSLRNKGMALYNSGKLKEALPFYKKLLIRAKHEMNRESTDYTNVLENVADLYFALKDYPKVEALHLEVKNVRQRVVGKEHPDYMNSLKALGWIYRAAENYSKAEPVYLEAKEISERLLGKDHPDYMTSLENLTWLYYNMPSYSKAEPLLVEIAEIIAKSKGKETGDYANSLNNLAALYNQMRNFSKAEPIYLEAKEIWVKVLGKDDPRYLTVVHNLALYYEAIVNYTKAEPLYSEALEIEARVVGKEHLDYAYTLEKLGILYETIGNYSKAEPILKEVIKIRAKAQGKEHLDYAGSLDHLAWLYNDMGNYSNAFPLQVEALKVRERVLGKEHPHYAVSLNDLALLARKDGRDSLALQWYTMAKEIFEKTVGKGDENYAVTLNNLAGLYVDHADYSKAESFYLQALEITKRAPSEVQHPDYPLRLQNLGGFYKSTGNYAKAEPLYLEAQKIWERVLGKEHPLYALSMNELSEVYEAMGNYEKAEALYVAQISIIQKQIIRQFPSLSEKEKQAYYAFNLNYVSGFESFCVKRQIQNPAILGDLYNLKLTTKGLLFNASNKMRQRILGSKDQTLIDQFHLWQTQKDYLSKVYKMSLDEKKKNGIDEKKLEGEANALEKELSLKSELFREASGTTQYKWEDVRSKLKIGEVAVEIILTQKKINGRYANVYVALIITAQTKNQPSIVILENGADLETKFSKYYHNTIKQKIKDEISYTQYWKPIADKIIGAKKVFFSADGIYNQINLNTLYNPATRKYVIDEIDVQMVSSTKDLLSPKKAIKSAIKNASLFGYPNYNNYQPAQRDVSPSLYNTIISKSAAILGDSSQRFFNGESIVELPGTKVEMETIEAIIKNKGIALKQFMYDEATEAEIKKVNSPQVLHIATHGFFIADIAAPKHNERGFTGIDDQKFYENPLLRSGLLFAGAKNAKSSRTEGEDGILNAYEAMSLDLDQTDLVVLSACETGLGVRGDGEGVYGLQRAFQVAGAKTVLMSLWTVSDEATQKLMTLFYESWLNGKTPREAFRMAQLSLREKYPEPYEWGAFVMVGN